MHSHMVKDMDATRSEGLGSLIQQSTIVCIFLITHTTEYQKSKNAIKKLAKDLKTFFHRRNINGSQVYVKMFDITSESS